MRSDATEYVEFVSARLARWHRAAYLLCGDEHRADDLVQTTVTKLYVHWDRAQKADNLDGYVHRMLVRSYIDERRLAWSKVWLMSATPDRGEPGESGVETRDLVVRALADLPKGQRTVLVMRFLCDMPVESVAAAMRCSTGNVKAQTARGLATLRERLGGETPFGVAVPASSGLRSEATREDGAFGAPGPARAERAPAGRAECGSGRGPA